MAGFCNTVLNFKELLGVDVGPGVFLTINNAGLQRAVYFFKRKLLRVCFHCFNHRNSNVRGLNAELQASSISRCQQRLVGGEVLNAVVNVAETNKADV